MKTNLSSCCNAEVREWKAYEGPDGYVCNKCDQCCRLASPKIPQLNVGDIFCEKHDIIFRTRVCPECLTEFNKKASPVTNYIDAKATESNLNISFEKNGIKVASPEVELVDMGSLPKGFIRPTSYDHTDTVKLSPEVIEKWDWNKTLKDLPRKTENGCWWVELGSVESLIKQLLSTQEKELREKIEEKAQSLHNLIGQDERQMVVKLGDILKLIKDNK